MVIQNVGGGEGVPRCQNGHVAVCVTRGVRLCRVCPECLAAAMLIVEQREMTVNDYLARLEYDGDVPKVSPAEARCASEVFRAARELYGDHSVGSVRKVVRDTSRAAGVSAAEAMKWTLKQFVSSGLAKLQESLQT